MAIPWWAEGVNGDTRTFEEAYKQSDANARAMKIRQGEQWAAEAKAADDRYNQTSLTRNTGPKNANDSWLGTVQERADVNSPWVDRAQQPVFGRPSASGFAVGGSPTTANLGFGQSPGAPDMGRSPGFAQQAQNGNFGMPGQAIPGTGFNGTQYGGSRGDGTGGYKPPRTGGVAPMPSNMTNPGYMDTRGAVNPFGRDQAVPDYMINESTGYMDTRGAVNPFGRDQAVPDYMINESTGYMDTRGAVNPYGKDQAVPDYMINESTGYMDTRGAVNPYGRETNKPAVMPDQRATTPAPPGQPTMQAGPAAQAGPAVLASSQSYNASNVDLANQYGQMGLSDPSQANARLLSGQVNNPYLDAQADNITRRLNRNLQENVLPGIGQGATMAGQYGSSRQGIAQGKAIGDTQDNLANALTNMYSGANEAAQQRMSTAAGNLSGIGAQVGTANAGFQNQASQFGANAANQASLANAAAQNQTNQFNAGQSNAYNIANMGNATTQRGQDQSYALGQMGNQTTQRGQDINQGIANMGNATTQRGQDQNYALGQMGNQTTQRGQDQNYALGQGNLGLGYQNSNNSYNLGVMNNTTTQRAQDLNHQVASGNLALGWQQAGNAYNLGLGNLNLGQQQANNAYNLGLGQLAVTNQGQNQNFYSTQRGQDLQQYQIGNQLYNNGVNGRIAVGQGQYGVGQQYLNAPMNAINQYGQAISPYTGYGQTQTQSGQNGGGANGVIGGGLAGAQIANNLYGGNQANRYNQAMGVNFTAPGVYG